MIRRTNPGCSAMLRCLMAMLAFGFVALAALPAVAHDHHGHHVAVQDAATHAPAAASAEAPRLGGHAAIARSEPPCIAHHGSGASCDRDTGGCGCSACLVMVLPASLSVAFAGPETGEPRCEGRRASSGCSPPERPPRA